MGYSLAWTVRAHDDAEKFSNGDRFGYGSTPDEAWRSLLDAVQQESEQAMERAQHVASLLVRVKAELEAARD